MEKALTIKDLHSALETAIMNGYGDKKILLSSDDEGNSYHEMFFAMSMVKDCVSADYQLPYGVNMDKAKKEYVILG